MSSRQSIELALRVDSISELLIGGQSLATKEVDFPGRMTAESHCRKFT